MKTVHFFNMKKYNALAFAGLLVLSACTGNGMIYSNGEFSWTEDAFIQDDFISQAPDAYTIVTNYPDPEFESGEWHLEKDLSDMPRYTAPTRLEEAIFNLALEEARKAVEPDSTLRTGVRWGGVWTRDVSYSTILGISMVQTEAAKKSLMAKVDRLGRIIQDTGTGGSWPCSTDRLIWVMAAYELYKASGDESWKAAIYPVIKRSLEDDRATVFDAETGLVRGESSYLDWRKQEYPLWMNSADIYQSENLGTECVHYAAWDILAKLEYELGNSTKASEYRQVADGIKTAINEKLWMADKGWYAQYLYGRRQLIPSPRFETLGEALTIILGICPEQKIAAMVQNAPCEDFGTPCFYPQIKGIPPYHNDAMWPFVQGYWNRAAAKAGNPDAVLHGIACIYRMAAFFLTNKENVVIYNGHCEGTQVNSSRQLWSIAAALSSVFNILMGIELQDEGIAFHPVVPEEMDGVRRLENFKWRKSVLDISVSGYGAGIKSFCIDGQECSDAFFSADLEGNHSVSIILDGRFPSRGVNMVHNLYAPGTPAPAKVLGSSTGKHFTWATDADNYIVLRNGVPVDTTSIGIYNVVQDGDYQVIAMGDEGWNSFASEPLEYHSLEIVRKIRLTTTKTVNTRINFGIDIPHTGIWSVDFLYNNPQDNFEHNNKCCNRTLYVNGKKAGLAVFPQVGKGLTSLLLRSSSLKLELEKGFNVFEITYTSENENMNIDVNECFIDSIRLTPIE